MSEIDDIKAQNTALLAEKAKAVERWHEEVRETLRTQGVDIATIKGSIERALLLYATIKELEAVVKEQGKRISMLENFQTKLIAYATTMIAVATIAWKFVDKLWK